MATAESNRAKCNGCGFEAPAGGDAWNRVEHPSLGRVTQCPECGGTNVHTRR